MDCERACASCLALAVVLAPLSAVPTVARAQVRNSTANRDVLIAAAGNAVIGALTAGTRASFRGKAVPRAMLGGAIGGLIHAGGKALVSQGRGAIPLGALVSSIGTSAVAAAGRAEPLWRAVTVPLGSVRIRVEQSGSGPRVRLSLNAYETLAILVMARRADVEVDVKRSLLVGAFVFVDTDGGLRAPRRGHADGFTVGAVVVVSGDAEMPAATFRHEVVHVQQQRYIQELWGLPVESMLRHRLRVTWLPEWLELGVAGPALIASESVLTGGGSGPLRRAQEWEARRWERRF